MPWVELRLFGNLRRFLPSPEGPSASIEVPEGTKLGDLLDRLQIPPTEPKILLVNGLHVGREFTLHDGDRVGVFPPIAGG